MCIRDSRRAVRRPLTCRAGRRLLLLRPMPPKNFDALLDRGVAQAVEIEQARRPPTLAGVGLVFAPVLAPVFASLAF